MPFAGDSPGTALDRIGDLLDDAIGAARGGLALAALDDLPHAVLWPLETLHRTPVAQVARRKLLIEPFRNGTEEILRHLAVADVAADHPVARSPDAATRHRHAALRGAVVSPICPQPNGTSAGTASSAADRRRRTVARPLGYAPKDSAGTPEIPVHKA